MIGDQKEQYLRLCEQAAIEQDPVKLMKLIAEIDRLLAEKEERLKATKLHGHADKAEPEAGTTNSTDAGS
jgi:hypothetical protein